MVLKLLSKDQKGNLKASRVLQLRQIAEQINNDRFTEGVEIIMNSYAPIASKQFIRAFIKGEDGEWLPIPLSITDAEGNNTICLWDEFTGERTVELFIHVSADDWARAALGGYAATINYRAAVE